MAAGAIRHDGLRVLIAGGDPARLASLAGVVAELGHDVVAQPIETSPGAALAARAQPDVALVSPGPSPERALELIDTIVHQAACPVIAVLHVPDPAFAEEASRRGVFAAITDRDPAEWQGTIDVALRRFAEYHGLQQAFIRRAMIERASGILMERHSVNGETASRMLRDAARRGNRKLSDLATAVVQGHGLLPADPA